MIIGLVGKKRSGKDTCADYMRENLCFEKLAFASGLKKMTSLKYSLQNNQFEQYKDSIDHRWGITPRDMFKEIGMEMREHDPYYWIKYLNKKLQKVTSDRVVISDVRFRNEEEYIRSIGGFIIRIIRSELEECNHISETESDSIYADFTIRNDGTKTLLFSNLDKTIECLFPYEG